MNFEMNAICISTSSFEIPCSIFFLFNSSPVYYLDLLYRQLSNQYPRLFVCLSIYLYSNHWPTFRFRYNFEMIFISYECIFYFCTCNCWIPCKSLVVLNRLLYARIDHVFTIIISYGTTLMMFFPFI